MQSYDIIRIKKYKKKENSYGGRMKLDLDGAQPLRRKSRDNKVKEVFHSATGKSDNETKLGTKLGTVWGGAACARVCSAAAAAADAVSGRFFRSSGRKFPHVFHGLVVFSLPQRVAEVESIATMLKTHFMGFFFHQKFHSKLASGFNKDFTVFTQIEKLIHYWA